MASGAYAVMVEDNRPKKEWVRRALRRVIACGLFCVPIELPVKIAVKLKQPAKEDPNGGAI